MKQSLKKITPGQYIQGRDQIRAEFALREAEKKEKEQAADQSR